ncbi:hypothetical protein TNCV_3526621 [Trichonephila clavipes]|nr:hypothetical protein TNCV_3526621 [Trichonephila clavipes]
MNIHRRLIERNLHSYRPLLLLPFKPAHCRARLQWYSNRSGWNHADLGHRDLATNPTSICVLTIIEDLSGDVQGSVPILHVTQALNQELLSGGHFF